MMNTILLIKPLLKRAQPEKYALPGLMVLFWMVLPVLLRKLDATVGTIDQSIWLLVLLALICFLLLLGFCWWLLGRFWSALGLPQFQEMVSQFNDLVLWQQLGFYYASFALLLLAGVGCLAAIC